MVKKVEGVINHNKGYHVKMVESYLLYININSYAINHINMEGSGFYWECWGLGLITTSLVTPKGLYYWFSLKNITTTKHIKSLSINQSTPKSLSTIYKVPQVPGWTTAKAGTFQVNREDLAIIQKNVDKEKLISLKCSAFFHQHGTQ